MIALCDRSGVSVLGLLPTVVADAVSAHVAWQYGVPYSLLHHVESEICANSCLSKVLAHLCQQCLSEVLGCANSS